MLYLPFPSPWTDVELVRPQTIMQRVAPSGTIVTYTWGKGMWFQLISLMSELDTAAPVANRRVIFEIYSQTGTNVILSINTNYDQVAGANIAYVFGESMSDASPAAAAASGLVSRPIPAIAWGGDWGGGSLASPAFGGGGQIKVTVSNAQAGDAWRYVTLVGTLWTLPIADDLKHESSFLDTLKKVAGIGG